MSEFNNIIETEENRLKGLIKETLEVIEEDKKHRQSLSSEISELRKEKLEVNDFSEKNRIEQRIQDLYKKSSLYIFQDEKILRNPYFGVLELSDDLLGDLSYKIGKKTIFGKNSKVSVIDWREAPVSRLFYEYEKDEEYDEDIRGKERSGKISLKRRISIQNRELKSVSEEDIVLSKDISGKWKTPEKTKSTSEIKKEKKDHCLPEITSLISREQFQAITLSPEKTFILQGGAGSGKTTIGLHRIAYLTYKSPEKFRPSEILVLMYNKSLQTYIKGVLPELGIAGGVKTETFHRFAFSIFSKTGFKTVYRQGPPSNAKIKNSAFVIKLLHNYTDILFKKSLEWIKEKFRLKEFESGVKVVSDAADLKDLIDILSTNETFKSLHELSENKAYINKILQRLKNHRLDLFKIFSDKEFILKTAEKENFKIDQKAVSVLTESEKNFYNQGAADFSDVGILVYLMQLKGIEASLPGYSHIMIDEAQDLSPAELAAVLNAADNKNSVTICGDMAQKIKSDVYFDNNTGFAGFVRSVSSSGSKRVSAETLKIGYRATKEIMEIAGHVTGFPPALMPAKSGEPVSVIKTSSFDETLFKAGALLASHHEQNPGALTCVICRLKKDADKVFNVLKENSSIKNIRRHERDDFVFTPGIIVTNAHQVKGLEFSAVAFINPSISQFKNNEEDKMLLHVAFTRASEKLWIIGHDEMAYGLEKFQNVLK
ncbi:MAG: UvrD-helicase domain-containing protein [Thermodesulfobacteriota bacterium]